MYYSIYPKLRAIYSYLPEEEEIETLLSSSGVSDFKNRLKELKIIKRFPLIDEDIEKHFNNLPFTLSKIVKDRLDGSPKEFFNHYKRIYELKDIKSVLRRGKGHYILFLEKENYTFSEIADFLKIGFWEEGWVRGYSRYKDTKKLLDLEISLDQYYYESLFNSSSKLPFSDRKETKDFIMRWIDITNRLWGYRLKHYYGMKTFEIRRFLIPEGSFYQNVEEIEEVSPATIKKVLFALCYKDFKLRIYKMRAILAFFLLFEIQLKRLISIYNSKLLALNQERIKQLIGFG